MQNLLEYIFFILFSYLVRIAGLNLSRRGSVILAFLFYYLIPLRKKTVIENLTNSFPDYSEDKIKQIAFNCYRSFAITLIELLAVPWLTLNQMKEMVECENAQLIVTRYKEGKGVILLSAHFGNWEYIALSVSLQINIPFYVVIKPQRNPYVTNWLEKARTKWINKVIESGMSVRQVYKEIINKNIVAMVADQRGPADGLKLEFMGRPASFFTGPAALSLKSAAPLLYGIAVRQKDYSYKSVIFEINQDNLPDNEEEKVKEVTRRHKEYLEGFIRDYPEQWFWMHKRWKH
ncbi:MAG TPA: lysophospholipid acyltransferase family protein [Ignavibacteriaceae bacterium]|nr:lysophospholipid acyltransferase family protein [Ignavibacteriaceae bacterium]